MAASSSGGAPAALEEGGEQKTAVVQDPPALALNWVFGFNKDVPSGVHHLGGSEIFYPAAHSGVIYDTMTTTPER